MNRRSSRAGRKLLSALICNLQILTLVALFPSHTIAGSKVSDDQELELLRARLRMEKRAFMKDSLALSEQESTRFWPIYYDYQAKLIRLYDRKYALIEQYAEEYPKLSENQAEQLVRESLETKKAQIELLEHYYNRFAKTLSKNMAARFVQMESTWNASFDLRLLSKLPTLPK